MTRHPGLHAITYNRAGSALRHDIAWLQYYADPEHIPVPSTPPDPEHDPAFDALSFYLRLDQRMVSYAAVIFFPIQHAGQIWQAAGLSCVATDRSYQGRGFGRIAVAAASQAIHASHADLGLFTCDPHLRSFYNQAGGWQPGEGLILIANSEPDALASHQLGKIVMLQLLSPRAQQAADAFRQTTINLGFQSGQFV
ncbi:MAG: GNAT family N-acetyltransferase [Roseiflexaceae bacterium]